MTIQISEEEKAFIENQKQRKLFRDSFGGTTFRHMINWFKSQADQNKPRIAIYDFNLYNSLERTNKITAVRNTGYYLMLREFRWGLPLYHEEKVGGVKKTSGDLDVAFKVVSGRNYDDLSIFDDDSLSDKKIDDIVRLYGFIKENNIEIKRSLDTARDLKFKGLDTDMFTPVFEYEYGYNLKNIKKGDIDSPSVSELNNGILFKDDESRLNALKLLYQELKKYLCPFEFEHLEGDWYKCINHNL